MGFYKIKTKLRDYNMQITAYSKNITGILMQYRMQYTAYRIPYPSTKNKQNRNKTNETKQKQKQKLAKKQKQNKSSECRVCRTPYKAYSTL